MTQSSHSQVYILQESVHMFNNVCKNILCRATCKIQKYPQMSNISRLGNGSIIAVCSHNGTLHSHDNGQLLLNSHSVLATEINC